MSDPWAEIDKIRREYWAMHDDLRGWLRLAKCLRASMPDRHPLRPSDLAIEVTERLVGPVKDPEPYEIYPLMEAPDDRHYP